MDAYCPECQRLMVWCGNNQHNNVQRNNAQDNNDQYYCEECQHSFLRLTLCPECKHPLQVLRACGAESYLCANGHGLISRSRVVIRYQSQ
ncbi:hypothetical protein Dpoa2040_003171 [Dickeya sp. CFBP 2040]|uniref:Primosomal protein N' (Replication factor Y)-superfamily II helicase n=1 Tax=Dickeya poaceiphila TaxID=568768 RepID=A0A5B8HID5_9GAMM|nr:MULTISPECIES: zinc ribbon domain-containing protein [Dickeya]NKI75846.1 hypothetical protein [Dickeya sp. CFBP 2040]QDX29226.1 hypothetical protein Dpoa569_0000958 [Dickeya poaceiphila]